MSKRDRLTADDLPIISSSTLAGAITCAACGYADAGFTGLAVGLAAGGFAGFLVGYSLCLVFEILLGVRETHGNATIAMRLGPRQLLGRVVQLAFMVAVTYEIHWVFHFQTLSNNFVMGQRIQQAAAAKTDRNVLAADLDKRRWLVDLAMARPSRWWLRKDYVSTSEVTVQVLDALGDDYPLNLYLPDDFPFEMPGRSESPGETDPFDDPNDPGLRGTDPEAAPGDSPHEPADKPRKKLPPGMTLASYAPSRHAVWATGEKPQISNAEMADLGQAICHFTRSQLRVDRPKTLLLRFLPADIFIPSRPR